jgi:1,4-dihydroxy-2-naphthoate octaprenyltransferase
VGYFTKIVLGFNYTSTAVATSTPETSTGSMSYLGTTTAVTEAVTNVICDVEADDTNDRITVSITAADSTNVVYWEVILAVYCTSFAEYTTEAGVGAYDGINK